MVEKIYPVTELNLCLSTSTTPGLKVNPELFSKLLLFFLYTQLPLSFHFDGHHRSRHVIGSSLLWFSLFGGLPYFDHFLI